MELPVRPARTVSVPVLVGGLVTTALTFALVFWLGERFGFNAMGQYWYYIIPIGALVVGVLAGSGYGIASWRTGFRIGKSTLWAVVAMQLVAYVVAKYIEYLIIASHGGAMPTFLPYLDEATRNIRFEDEDGSVGSPLGMLGYGILLLETAAFVGGAVMVPAALRSKAYCDSCGTYMRSKGVGTLPASVKARMMVMKGADVKAEYEAEQEAARVQGMQVHDRLFALARTNDAAGFAEAVSLIKEGTKAANKLPTRFPISLASCPTCRRGILSSQVMTGQGRQTSTAPLEATDVAPAMVRSLDGV